MKKKLLWLLVLVMCISIATTFSLAGCKEEVPAEEEVAAEAPAEEVAEESTEEEPVAEEPVTLEVWHNWHEPSTNAVYDELAGEFMEANPNVTIKSSVYSLEEYLKVARMALASGTGPDVLHGDPSISGGMMLLASEGHLLSLTDMAEQYKWLDRMPGWYIEYFNRAFLPDIYGIALDTEVVGVWYNKEIFSDLGLTPPTKWPEFENIIDKVAEAGYQPFAMGNLDMWPGGFPFETFVHGKVSMDDIHEFMDLSGKVAWTDKGFVESARLAQEWALKGYFGKDFNSISYDDSFSQIYTEKAAMFIMGNWAISALDENCTFDYGFFLMPPSDPNIPIAAMGSPSNTYSINKTVEEDGKAEIAGKFVDFMLSEHAAEKFYEAGKIVGIKIDTTGLKGIRAQDEVIEALSILGESEGGLGCYLGNWWPTSWDSASALMQPLLESEITPEEFCQQVQEDYGKYVKE
jgi:raffinose/stachyose/melibiose transport system substrate-binding protein